MNKYVDVYFDGFTNHDTTHDNRDGTFDLYDEFGTQVGIRILNIECINVVDPNEEIAIPEYALTMGDCF